MLKQGLTIAMCPMIPTNTYVIHYQVFNLQESINNILIHVMWRLVGIIMVLDHIIILLTTVVKKNELTIAN